MGRIEVRRLVAKPVRRRPNTRAVMAVAMRLAAGARVVETAPEEMEWEEVAGWEMDEGEVLVVKVGAAALAASAETLAQAVTLAATAAAVAAAELVAVVALSVASVAVVGGSSRCSIHKRCTVGLGTWQRCPEPMSCKQ